VVEEPRKHSPEFYRFTDSKKDERNNMRTPAQVMRNNAAVAFQKIISIRKQLPKSEATASAESRIIKNLNSAEIAMLAEALEGYCTTETGGAQ